MNDRALIEAARKLAHDAHDSIEQKRKYSGAPYWVHTDAVAETVAKYTEDVDVIIAAHLHDVIEDVFPVNPIYDLYLIAKLFGERVAKLVVEVTDVYTREAWPDLNRVKRKALEAERIAKISPEAKLIKLADNLDNTASITENDKDFAKIYLGEVWTKLADLKEGNAELHAIVEKQMLSAMMQINLKPS